MQLVQNLVYIFIHLSIVHQSSLHRLIAQGHILTYREVFHHKGLLVHLGNLSVYNSVIGIFKMHFLAVKLYHAFVLRVNTVENIQQGGFSRAVFSQKGVYLSLLN